jgi:hypothetical protein
MQRDFNTIVKNQLRLLGLFIVLTITFSVMAAFTARDMYSDIWQQLGISKLKGEENIKLSFLNGYFNYYGAEKAKNIVSGNRTEVAKDLMNYAKEYVSSEAFKKQYTKMREEARPEDLTEKLPTKEEVRKEKIAEMERSLAEANKTIKAMPEMAKTLQEVVDMLKETLKDYKDPNSQNIEAFYQGEIYEHESRIKRNQERLAEWEKDYPADHRIIIRERLQKFIGIAKKVDFSAELKTVGNKKKFVNPAYEAKPDEWKQIFRAGKEIIEPAIAFAEKWIREL